MKEWYDLTDYFLHKSDIESRLIYETGIPKPDIETTISIPAYRRADLLEEAIDSILNQRNYDNYEILIIDDYPNETTDIEQMLRNKTSIVESGVYLRYYRNVQNLGMGANWNRCISMAGGKWVVILHDDDLLGENYLSTVIPMANRTGCNLVGTFSYQMNLLERGSDSVKYTVKLAKNKDLLKKIKRGKPFRLIPSDLLYFIQPSPGCWTLNKEWNLNHGGYDVSRMKNGLIDGPFNFKNTYHGKTIIVPQFLFTRRIKQNDFLNPEAQTEILKGLYIYIRHFSERYGKGAKLIVDISILNFAQGIRAKYNALIDSKQILKELGVNGFLLNLPGKAIKMINAVGLSRLIFRRTE